MVGFVGRSVVGLAVVRHTKASQLDLWDTVVRCNIIYCFSVIHYHFSTAAQFCIMLMVGRCVALVIFKSVHMCSQTEYRTIVMSIPGVMLE